jgi:hypothetical protein
VANQKRETKRERRDEAKRRRLEELRRRQRQERMRKLAYFGIAGAVIAGIIAAVMFLGGDDVDPELNRLAAAAGCDPVQNPGIIASDHIAPPARGTYSTNPPTSGKHYNAAGLGPVTTGIHRAAVPYEGSTHNLEHGHIVIHYKESVGPVIAGVLAEIVRADPRWVMLSPNPNMPSQVAFTAWGHLMACDSPNEQIAAAGRKFAEEFKDDAPESAAGTPEAGTDTATPPVSTASPTASPTSSTPSSPSPTATPTST